MSSLWISGFNERRNPKQTWKNIYKQRRQKMKNFKLIILLVLILPLKSYSFPFDNFSKVKKGVPVRIHSEIIPSNSSPFGSKALQKKAKRNEITSIEQDGTLIIKSFKKDILFIPKFDLQTKSLVNHYFYEIGFDSSSNKNFKSIEKPLRLIYYFKGGQEENDISFIPISTIVEESIEEAAWQIINNVKLGLNFYIHPPVHTQKEITDLSENLLKHEFEMLEKTLLYHIYDKVQRPLTEKELDTYLKYIRKKPFYQDQKYKRTNMLRKFIMGSVSHNKLYSYNNDEPFYKNVEIQFSSSSKEIDKDGNEIIKIHLHMKFNLYKKQEKNLAPLKQNLSDLIFETSILSLASFLSFQNGVVTQKLKEVKSKSYELKELSPLLNCQLTNDFIDSMLYLNELLYQPEATTYWSSRIHKKSQDVHFQGEKPFIISSFLEIISRKEEIDFKKGDFENFNIFAQKILSEKNILNELMQILNRSFIPLSNISTPPLSSQEVMLKNSSVGKNQKTNMLIEILFTHKDIILKDMESIREFIKRKQEKRKKALSSLKNFYLKVFNSYDVIFLESDIKEFHTQLSFLDNSTRLFTKSMCKKIVSFYAKSLLMYKKRYNDLESFMKLDFEETKDSYKLSEIQIKEISTQLEENNMKQNPSTISEQRAIAVNKFKLMLNTENFKYETQRQRENLISYFLSVHDLQFIEKLNFLSASNIKFLEKTHLTSLSALNVDELGSEFKTFVYEIFLEAFYPFVNKYNAFFLDSHFKDSLTGSFAGIGVKLDRFVTGYDRVKIDFVFPEGPAEEVGLNVGDSITHIKSTPNSAWIPVQGLSIEEIIDNIRGSTNTPVELRIKRGDKDLEEELKIIRKQIQKNIYTPLSIFEIEETNSQTGKTNTLKVGVIKVFSFPMNVHKKIEQTIDLAKSKEVQSLIIDLTSNPGGLLSEAMSTVALFIENGLIVIRKGFGGTSYSEAVNTHKKWTGPLTVLINSKSASSSEVVTGALKDHRRALIVGSPFTFGKFTVQQMKPFERLLSHQDYSSELMENLNSKYTAKITTDFYFNPNGEFLNGKGVASHIVLPSLKDDMKNLLDDYSQSITEPPYNSLYNYQEFIPSDPQITDENIQVIQGLIEKKSDSTTYTVRLLESGTLYNENLFDETNKIPSHISEAVHASFYLYKMQQQ